MALKKHLELTPSVMVPKNPVYRACYHVVESRKARFDEFILWHILLNTTSMCFAHHGMSDNFALGLEIVDMYFAAVFTLEAALKIGGTGWDVYWTSH